MDIEEFEKRQQPRAKRSRLEPFQVQIFELKAKGYANWQVCQWLAENGLKISQEGLRKFIKSRENSSPSPASMPSANTAPASAAPEVSSAPAVPEVGASSPADYLAGLDKKQKREKLADRFLGDEAKPKNSLASRLINQEKTK